MENIKEQDLNLSNAKIIYQNANKIQIFVTRLTTGEECVVKKQKVQSASESNDLMKECAAMMTLNHPNIVSIKTHLFTDKYEYILIVMDFYREGDLFKEIQTRLQKSNFWSKETLLNIWKDLIGGHAYMQSRGVAHRDIKPQNILKKGDQYIISDLGCAFKSKNTSSDTIAGTPSFLSPLLRLAYQRAHAGLSLQGFDHNIFKSDVFSLGLTFLFMASLQPIEEFSTSDFGEFSRIKQKRIESLKYDNEIKGLLSSMIEFEEEKRPDFQDLASIIKSITKAVANNNPGNLFENLSSQNPSRDLEYENLSQQINLPVQNFNKIPLSYGGNNPENQSRNYNLRQINSSENPISPYIVPRRFSSQKFNQNIYRLRDDIQKYTENMNLTFMCFEKNTKYFKWTVKIKYSIAELYLKNLILHAIQTCDPNCLYYVYILASFFHIKLFVLPLYYKCKICNYPIENSEILRAFKCGGFIHKLCFYQKAKYIYDSRFVYLAFDCISCAVTHENLYKELPMCTSCGKITFYKRFINQTVCLSCIELLQCDDSSQADYNYFLESFKAIGKVSIEAYSNLNNTCDLCGNIPDILMSNCHLYCYECVFCNLNNQEFIKCHLGCCFFQKKNPLEIKSNMLQTPINLTPPVKKKSLGVWDHINIKSLFTKEAKLEFKIPK
jgi:serine/threonine protein kinase